MPVVVGSNPTIPTTWFSDMQAFDWINDIVRWFAQFVPQWDLLDPTEGGVKFRPGHKIVLLKPGHIYWWWPITTNVYTIETKRQTMDISQRLTTADDISVMVDTVIVYIIDDVEKAIVDTRDHENTISEIGEKVTVKPIMSRTFEETRVAIADSNKLNNEIKSGARTELGAYGVTVVDGYISSYVETKVFSHDGTGMAIGEEYDYEDE